MERTETIFGMKFQNIPIINLREEFKNFYRLLSTEEFREKCQLPSKPIHTPYFVWLGRPAEFLTLLLQRALMGIEAYLPHAVLYQLAVTQPLTQDKTNRVQNPFLLGGRGTADNYYNRLPAMANQKYSLCNHNPQLWEKTRKFYIEVRNPLFHGQQLHNTDAILVFNAFDHIADLYEWIDSWHSLDETIPGASAALKVKG